MENGGCKTPAVGDSNQVWTQLPGNLLQTASNHYHGKPPMCLTLTAGSVGGTLSTTDDEGQKWLMKAPQWQESNAVRAGSAQSAKGTTWQVNADPHSPGNVTITGQMRSSYMPSQLGFLEEFGASGPLPHTRYLQPGHSSWTFDSNAKGGAMIKLAAGTAVTDDDGVGGVKPATGDFCVELSRAGNLEAWHAPLSAGRHAIAFVNRSPAPSQAMKLELPKTLGLEGVGASFKVKEIWSGKELPGTVSNTLEATVEAAHGSLFFILTPSSE